MSNVSPLCQLPAPALESVIQHACLAVGLYKAVRLRLVCKVLDSEVKRTVFGSSLFDLSAYQGSNNITPELMSLHLRAQVRASLRDGKANPITSYLRKAACNLDSMDSKVDRQALIRAICDAAAHGGQVRYQTHLRFSTLLDTAAPCREHVFEPIVVAAALGDVEQIRRLLAEGHGRHSSDPILGYPLEHAARQGNLRIMTALLCDENLEDQSPEKTSSLSAAYGAAARSGQKDAIDAICRYNGDKISSADLELICVQAAGNGHLRLLQWSLDCNQNAAETANKAFVEAVKQGRLDCVRELLDRGADCNHRQHPNSNALHLAAARGDSLVVQELMSRGIEYFAGQIGDPLTAAAGRGHKDVVQYFINQGIELRTACGRGCNVLTHTAQHGETAMLLFLVAKGYPVSERKLGLALEKAAEQGHDKTVVSLVELGAPLDGIDGRDPPVLRGLIYGRSATVKLLIGLGASPVDPLQTTAAHRFQSGEFPLPRSEFGEHRVHESMIDAPGIR